MAHQKTVHLPTQSQAANVGIITDGTAIGFVMESNFPDINLFGLLGITLWSLMDKSFLNQASLEVTTGPAHQHGHGGFRIDRLVVFKPAVDHFIHRSVSTDGNDLIGPLLKRLAGQNCGMSGIFRETGGDGAMHRFQCLFQFIPTFSRFASSGSRIEDCKSFQSVLLSVNLYDNGLAKLCPSGFNLRGIQCYY